MSFYPLIALVCMIFLAAYLWFVGSTSAALLVAVVALFMAVVAVVVERDI